MPEMHLTIHTAGAGNPGPGGFAAIIESPKHGKLVISGGDPKTTNNRMELSAIIEALKAINATASSKNASITIRSDSKYVIEAFNQNWIAKWQRNGWSTAQNKPVINPDLWKELLDEIQGHHLTWTWVKGHSGDPMNERCNRLAVQQAEIASRENQYWVTIGTTPKHQTETHEPETGAATPKQPATEQQNVGWNQIFISHQKEDSKTAKDLARGIREAGINCYLDLDDRSTDGNKALGYHIRMKLRECEAMIVVVSEKTRESWWVPMEVGAALESGKHIAVFMKGEPELPEYLEQWEQLKDIEDAKNWATDPDRRRRKFIEIAFDNYAEGIAIEAVKQDEHAS